MLYRSRPGYGVTDNSPQVLVPMPGQVPIGAGHWYRAKTSHKVKPAPRKGAKPTSGRGIQVAAQHSIKRQRPKPCKDFRK